MAYRERTVPAAMLTPFCDDAIETIPESAPRKAAVLPTRERPVAAPANTFDADCRDVIPTLCMTTDVAAYVDTLPILSSVMGAAAVVKRATPEPAATLSADADFRFMNAVEATERELPDTRYASADADIEREPEEALSMTACEAMSEMSALLVARKLPVVARERALPPKP